MTRITLGSVLSIALALAAPALAQDDLGARLYFNHCAACHGVDRAGHPPEFPSLVGITERLTFSEHLSFTPWHTLAHEPLGSINQARRIVYETISSLRHEMNGKRRREPLPGESPADYLRSL